MLLSAVGIFESIDPRLACDTMLEALDETHFRGALMTGSTPAELGSAALQLFTCASSGDELGDLVGRSTACCTARGSSVLYRR